MISRILLIGLLVVSGSLTAQDSLQINDIVISGNTKTKEWVILRELNLKEGDKIALQDTLQFLFKNKKQILNSALFNEVNLTISANTLLIEVTEKWYFWPIPMIEFADRNFNQWWLSKDPRRLIYGTELKYYNVRGGNEQLTAVLTLGYTKQADITYLIPLIKKRQNLGFIFSFAHLSNKEVWYQTSENKVQFYNDVDQVGIRRNKASAGIIRRKGISQYQYYKIKWEQAKTTDTIVALNPNFFGKGSKKLNLYTFNYNFILDKRDIRGQPLKGNYYNVNVDLNWINPPITSAFMPVINYRSSHFRPIGGRWYTSAGLHLKLSYPNEQPYRYNRALGYDYNVLRGYEYYVVDGTHSVALKSNLKYALMLNQKKNFGFIPGENYKTANNTLFLLGFYDMGYAHNTNALLGNTFANRLLYGYGLGVEWVVWYDYMVRFEVARNHANELGFFVSFKMGV